MNNSKEKNDNNNVDNIDRSILPNQDIKRKSDNSSYSVSNTKIKFSTKGKHKILNDDDNNNDNWSIWINELLFGSNSVTKKMNVKIN